MHYGESVVTIPAGHRRGRLERPPFWFLGQKAKPEKHFTIQELKELGLEDFVKRVDEAASRSKRHEALIFIHGFNVKFTDAVKRIAQIAHDLKFDGVPLLYSWASNGRVLDYVSDGNNAHSTIPRLSTLLDVIAGNTCVERVHILAHSMGNRPVCDVLGRMAREQRPMAQLKHVVLAAPDVDCDTFTNLAGDFCRVAQSVTLYASDKDKAMAVSKRINRATRAGEPMLIIPGVHSIDASAVDTDFLAHGYFSDARTVLSDTFHLIRDLPPENRELDPRTKDGGAYYAIPA